MLSKSISSSKTIAIDTSSNQTTSNQTTIAGNQTTIITGSFMKFELNLSEPCKDNMDCFGKGFCVYPLLILV